MKITLFCFVVIILLIWVVDDVLDLVLKIKNFRAKNDNYEKD